MASPMACSFPAKHLKSNDLYDFTLCVEPIGNKFLQSTNTRLADLNIQNLSRVDDRRIEVIANGLPMWGGNQLAVDTTLVSPLTRSGEPRSRGGTYARAALQDARRNKERTYPELLQNGRCRLVVLGIEVGGRWSNEASNFIRMLANARACSSSHPCGSGVQVVRSPHPRRSDVLRCQPVV